MGMDERIQERDARDAQMATGNFGNNDFGRQTHAAAAMLQRGGMERDEAYAYLQDQDLWKEDKYQGMLKSDAQMLREDWFKTKEAEMHQAKLDALRGTVQPDVPRVNAPAVAAPDQGGGGVSMPAPSEMPNGGVPAGTTPAAPTSPWSYKAPQLQVGVTDPAAPVQYDYSHLQKQPLQSAAEKFGAGTEQSRALRSGIGSRYSGGGQNG